VECEKQSHPQEVELQDVTSGEKFGLVSSRYTESFGGLLEGKDNDTDAEQDLSLPTDDPEHSDAILHEIGIDTALCWVPLVANSSPLNSGSGCAVIGCDQLVAYPEPVSVTSATKASHIHGLKWFDLHVRQIEVDPRSGSVELEGAVDQSELMVMEVMVIESEKAVTNWEVIGPGVKQKPDNHHTPALDPKDTAANKKAHIAIHQVSTNCQHNGISTNVKQTTSPEASTSSDQGLPVFFKVQHGVPSKYNVASKSSAAPSQDNMNNSLTWLSSPLKLPDAAKLTRSERLYSIATHTGI
jgi:hypothetical protein